MKVALINPPRFKKTPVVREARCAGFSPASIYPPLKLAYIASYLELKGLKVALFDANGLGCDFDAVERFLKETSPKIVIYTSSPPTMNYDSRVANLAKKLSVGEVITVLDDTHIAPAMPGKVLELFPDVDILVRGESEATIYELIVNIDSMSAVKGISFRSPTGLKSTEPQKAIDLDSIPSPAYHLLPVNNYFSLTFSRRKPFATILTSVSCPFNCSFCIVGGTTVWRGYGNRWRAKSPDKVVSEISHLNENFRIKSFYFFDETFTIDKQRVIEISKRIAAAKINIEWSCNSRTDTVDEEMLGAMKRSGCWNICYGVETGSERLLKNVNKKTYMDDAEQIFKATRRIGISPSASFMIGLPDEDNETLRETLHYAKRLDPSRCQFVLTTPYPKTRLYDELKIGDMIETDYDFSNYDAYCIVEEPVIRTKKLGAADLIRWKKRIHLKFYLRLGFLFRTLLRVRSFPELLNLIRAFRYLN